MLLSCYWSLIFGRLEGAHAVLKRWIGKPTKNLWGVWQSCQLALTAQINEIRSELDSQLHSEPTSISGPLYSGLVGKITHQGLYHLREQFTIYKRKLKSRRIPDYDIEAEEAGCTGSYTSSMGILCWHEIERRIASEKPIQPSDFHPHWHLLRPKDGAEQSPPVQPVLDPVPRRARRNVEAERRAHSRAYTRAIRKSKTGRILSQFEQGQKIFRHCSACTGYEHNKTTCQGCRSTTHTRRSCPYLQEETNLPNHELQNLRQLQQSLSGIIGSKSKDQGDRAGQNDIPGAAEENSIEALATLEEYETIEPPTQQPTWTRKIDSTEEPPAKRARGSIAARHRTIKPPKPTKLYTSRLAESVPISSQPTGQMPGVTQGYRGLSPRAVDHDQFADHSAAVRHSYVQQQSQYSFQPHMGPHVVMSQCDTVRPFQASIFPRPGPHSYSQNYYQNGYLPPQTWTSYTPDAASHTASHRQDQVSVPLQQNPGRQHFPFNFSSS